jgi:two-component system, sensor histidine kinase and response regulator
LFRLQAQAKTIVLKYMVNSDIQVFADEAYTNMVLRNLVSNALKFTKEGGEVIVSAKVKNNFVEVSIADSGVGIATTNLKNLFKIDKQVSSQGTFGEKGTGLGLILSKEFVEKNGGVLNVISEEGKGSVFSFSVPIAQIDA